MRSIDSSEHEMTGEVVGKPLLGQLQLGRLPHCQVRVRRPGSWQGLGVAGQAEGMKPLVTSKRPEQSQLLQLITFLISIGTASTTVPGNQAHFNQTLLFQNIRREWGLLGYSILSEPCISLWMDASGNKHWAPVSRYRRVCLAFCL